MTVETYEYDIVQNSALGSIAIWKFAVEYYKASNKTKGPILPLTMLVLPLVFHEQTVLSLFNRNLEGGLFRAISEDRTISVGLQHRMQAMADQTMMAINIAFAGNLIEYDKETTQIIPVRMTEPSQIDVGDTKQILAATKRIGFWFSCLSIEQICVLLKVRF